MDERENGHRPLGEMCLMPRQETACIFVPASNIERRPQHNRAIPIERAHTGHEPDVYRKSPFGQCRRDSLGHFLRRAITGGIGEQNRIGIWLSP